MSSFLYQNLVSFRPPRLLNNSLGWHIEYYVLDPVTSKLMRKRFRLNDLHRQCATGAEFKQKANQVLQELTTKLVAGWNPQGEVQSSRYYTSLFEAFDKFLEAKRRELREESMRTYSGIVKLLKEWIKRDCVCIDFGRQQALDFMDYCYVKRKVSANTWNNYLKVCRVIGQWMFDNLYMKENPFSRIKKKRSEEKIRDIIPVEVRKRIAEYFEKRSEGYLLVCYLVFYSLIRPAELTRLRVRDIDREKGIIFLPSESTKCHTSRFTPIDPSIRERLYHFIDGHLSSEYVFGGMFRPGPKAQRIKWYHVKWEKMREDLQLPFEYKLYSLRDSGIRSKLAVDVDPTVVMHAAGHHNLAETTKYVIKANTTELETIVANSPSFI